MVDNNPNNPRKNGQNRNHRNVTINKVTVSFLSFESAGPALGERGLFFTVEMIIAFESVRMTTIRKV